MVPKPPPKAPAVSPYDEGQHASVTMPKVVPQPPPFPPPQNGVEQTFVLVPKVVPRAPPKAPAISLDDEGQHASVTMPKVVPKPPPYPPRHAGPQTPVPTPASVKEDWFIVVDDKGEYRCLACNRSGNWGHIISDKHRWYTQDELSAITAVRHQWKCNHRQYFTHAIMEKIGVL